MPRVKRISVGERRNQRKMRMRETRQNAQAEKINIKSEDINRSELNIFKVPDGGSVNPAVTSHDGMVPSGSSDANNIPDGGSVNPAVPSHDGMVPSGPSDANSHTHSYTHSYTHSLAYSDTDSLTNSAAHSPTHSDTHSPTHSDTHSPTHSDTLSPTHTPPDSDTHPHNDSHRTLIDCKKSFAAHFLESSENDCLKTRTDFDETFVEAFPNIVVKGHSCNNKQLPKTKVENKGID